MNLGFVRLTRRSTRFSRTPYRALVGAAALLCLSSLAALRAAESAAAPGWHSLPLIAEGRIAPGWTQVGWGGFVVDGDALRTAPDPRGLGLLVFQRERFGNCQIRVVFKALEAKSNAGVYVRLDDDILKQIGRPGAVFERNAAGKISKASMELMKISNEREEGPWFAVHHGYEIQIADAGDALHRTGAVYSLAPSSAESRPGQWRTMIISLRGDDIAVELDGQHVTSFDPHATGLPPRKNWFEPKREPKRPTVGYIGLQNHDPGDIVWFKEVAVRAL